MPPSPVRELLPRAIPLPVPPPAGDRRRGKKSTAIELDVGRVLKPTITPADPETVLRIVWSHLAH